MIKGAAFVLLSALSLINAGCSSTVHQEFERQPVPQIAAGANTLPLRIAVLSDKSMTFDYPPITFVREFVEVMNPGLADTLQTAFYGCFQDVTVVQTRNEALGADLLLSPSLELSDPLRLTVRFVEPNSGRLITELSSVRPYKSDAPGVYNNLGTDFMLAAVVLAFPPSEIYVTHKIQEHNAERYNATFAPAVAQMVSDVAAQAPRNRALRAYARDRISAQASNRF